MAGGFGTIMFIASTVMSKLKGGKGSVSEQDFDGINKDLKLEKAKPVPKTSIRPVEEVITELHAKVPTSSDPEISPITNAIRGSSEALARNQIELFKKQSASIDGLNKNVETAINNQVILLDGILSYGALNASITGKGGSGSGSEKSSSSGILTSILSGIAGIAIVVSSIMVGLGTVVEKIKDEIKNTFSPQQAKASDELIAAASVISDELSSRISELDDKINQLSQKEDSLMRTADDIEKAVKDFRVEGSGLLEDLRSFFNTGKFGDSTRIRQNQNSLIEMVKIASQPEYNLQNSEDMNLLIKGIIDPSNEEVINKLNEMYGLTLKSGESFNNISKILTVIDEKIYDVETQAYHADEFSESFHELMEEGIITEKNFDESYGNLITSLTEQVKVNEELLGARQELAETNVESAKLRVAYDQISDVKRNLNAENHREELGVLDSGIKLLSKFINSAKSTSGIVQLPQSKIGEVLGYFVSKPEDLLDGLLKEGPEFLQKLKSNWETNHNNDPLYDVGEKYIEDLQEVVDTELENPESQLNKYLETAKKVVEVESTAGTKKFVKNIKKGEYGKFLKDYLNDNLKILDDATKSNSTEQMRIVNSIGLGHIQLFDKEGNDVSSSLPDLHIAIANQGRYYDELNKETGKFEPKEFSDYTFKVNGKETTNYIDALNYLTDEQKEEVEQDSEILDEQLKRFDDVEQKLDILIKQSAEKSLDTGMSLTLYNSPNYVNFEEKDLSSDGQ